MPIIHNRLYGRVISSFRTTLDFKLFALALMFFAGSLSLRGEDVERSEPVRNERVDQLETQSKQLKTETHKLRSEVDSLGNRISRETRDLESDVRSVRDQLHALERDRRRESRNESGLALFMVGVFCALWAQNTGRSAWLWFFLGLFFNVVTLLVLLAKNSNDNAERRRSGRTGYY